MRLVPVVLSVEPVPYTSGFSSGWSVRFEISNGVDAPEIWVEDRVWPSVQVASKRCETLLKRLSGCTSRDEARGRLLEIDKDEGRLN